MPTAIVLGAGIAGLSAAIALDSAGYETAVLERAPMLEPIGAALSLWPNAIAALRQLEAADEIEREAAPILAVGAKDRFGHWIMGPLPVRPQAGCGGFLPTRALLQRALLDRAKGIAIRLGTLVEHVVVGQDRPAVVLGNGQTWTADLVIDATGIGSERASSILASELYKAGYSGVLALSDPVDTPDPGVAMEYWGDNERFGDFALGDGRRYWFYMHGRESGPADLSHPALLRHAADWPSNVQHAITATSPDALIPTDIRARRAPRRLGLGNLILVGDAAHPMEPNLGQGACQALEDAACLQTLARAVPPNRLLAAFETARLKRIRQLVAMSARAAGPVHAGPVRRRAFRLAARMLPNSLHQLAADRIQRPSGW